MTIQDILDKIPMGLGSYGVSLMTIHAPDLAEKVIAKIDVPIRAVSIEFADGDQIRQEAPALLEGQNATSTDDRPALAADGGAPAGAAAVAG